MCLELAERLDGAKYIRYDPAHQLVFIWYGGHGVHGYSAHDGKEVAFWNTGTFEKDDALLSEIKQSVENHIRDEYFPY